MLRRCLFDRGDFGHLFLMSGVAKTLHKIHAVSIDRYDQG